jgi:hypothetical protein
MAAFYEGPRLFQTQRPEGNTKSTKDTKKFAFNPFFVLFVLLVFPF